MNVFSYHPLQEGQIQRIKQLGIDNLKILSPSEEPIPFLKDAEVIFSVSSFPQKILDQAPKLRWLQVSSAGVNQLPLKSLEERGILLTNVRGMHGDCISEYVLAMMFALNRQLPKTLEYQKMSQWHKMGQSMLKGKTLGIIGLGGIGQILANKAAFLGMEVIGLRNSKKPAENVSRMYSNEDLLTFMAQSDYVAVCCPLTPETTGLVSKEAIAAMKPTASLINIARGQVIDEPALIEALQNKKIASAALDVFWKEPLPETSPLWALDNLILTPHVAGDMIDYTERAADIFVSNLERYLKKQTLQGLVDYRLGY
jgi:phosphoglycerate dehydrogenase-like enzyme